MKGELGGAGGSKRHFFLIQPNPKGTSSGCLFRLTREVLFLSWPQGGSVLHSKTKHSHPPPPHPSPPPPPRPIYPTTSMAIATVN